MDVPILEAKCGDGEWTVGRVHGTLYARFELDEETTMKPPRQGCCPSHGIDLGHPVTFS